MTAFTIFAKAKFRDVRERRGGGRFRLGKNCKIWLKSLKFSFHYLPLFQRYGVAGFLVGCAPTAKEKCVQVGIGSRNIKASIPSPPTPPPIVNFYKARVKYFICLEHLPGKLLCTHLAKCKFRFDLIIDVAKYYINQ